MANAVVGIPFSLVERERKKLEEIKTPKDPSWNWSWVSENYARKKKVFIKENQVTYVEEPYDDLRYKYALNKFLTYCEKKLYEQLQSLNPRTEAQQKQLDDFDEKIAKKADAYESVVRYHRKKVTTLVTKVTQEEEAHPTIQDLKGYTETALNFDQLYADTSYARRVLRLAKAKVEQATTNLNNAKSARDELRNGIINDMTQHVMTQAENQYARRLIGDAEALIDFWHRKLDEALNEEQAAQAEVDFLEPQLEVAQVSSHKSAQVTVGVHTKMEGGTSSVGGGSISGPNAKVDVSFRPPEPHEKSYVNEYKPPELPQDPKIPPAYQYPDTWEDRTGDGVPDPPEPDPNDSFQPQPDPDPDKGKCPGIPFTSLWRLKWVHSKNTCCLTNLSGSAPNTGNGVPREVDTFLEAMMPEGRVECPRLVYYTAEFVRDPCPPGLEDRTEPFDNNKVEFDFTGIRQSRDTSGDNGYTISFEIIHEPTNNVWWVMYYFPFPEVWEEKTGTEFGKADFNLNSLSLFKTYPGQDAYLSLQKWLMVYGPSGPWKSRVVILDAPVRSLLANVKYGGVMVGEMVRLPRAPFWLAMQAYVPGSTPGIPLCRSGAN